MSATVPNALAGWHEIVAARDPAKLDTLLADDVVFLSPVVHRPQAGKAITTKYLAAALRVLGPEFRYLGEWIGETSAVLEFASVIDGIEVNGVDIIGWNAEGKIDRFKVMVRPMKGMEALRQRMAVELGLAASPGGSG